MNNEKAEALSQEWHRHCRREDPELESWDQMRSLLLSLAPETRYAAVVPMSGDSTPPEGSTWLSHEIVVLGEGCIVRFAGVEGAQVEGVTKPVFSACAVRVPLSEFKRVQVFDRRVPAQKQATRHSQHWEFLEETKPGLSIAISGRVDQTCPGPVAALVHQLARRIGWPIDLGARHANEALPCSTKVMADQDRRGVAEQTDWTDRAVRRVVQRAHASHIED